MDTIYLNKMEFYGYHGVLPEETRLGQKFMVDLQVEANLQQAGRTDNLEDSISYVDIYEVCKSIVEGDPYKLIEAVAEKIAAEILVRFAKILSITVKVIKPNPPIPGHYESVAVEITRRRPEA